MSEIEVVQVSNAAEMNQALSVRRSVFIVEQGVDEAIEIDEHDGDPATVRSALHVLCRSRGQAVATGRLLLTPDEQGIPHIGRVAVLAAYRGTGAGRSIMLALQDLARQRGFTAVTLGAQLTARGFYEKLGYAARGEVFMEAGMAHIMMDLSLEA